MNGGYVMIDCMGLDLTDESTQTINGIYDKVETAYKTGKPVFANNCEWGTGLVMSPIPIMVIPLNSGVYTCTAATLQINIDDENGVTITNLVSA